MECSSISYSPSKLGLNYFDHNHRHIVSHKLSSSIEGDTWNAHPYRIHLLNSGLNYFDHNHRRIVSHKLGSDIERDTWNDHPYRIHLFKLVLITLFIITAI